MKINREKLFKLYMADVDHIAEVCDWKTQFGPEEIVNMIAEIIEKNKDIVEHKPIKKKTNNMADQNEEQSSPVVYGLFYYVPYENALLVGIYFSEEAAETARLEWRTDDTRVVPLQAGLPADICFIYAS